MTRKFLTVALISALAGAASMIVHTWLAGSLHAERPILFVIAAVIVPLGLVVGLVGAAVCAFVAWRRRVHPA
jgi:ABC-type Fe3+-siderophore transport system permease subunit